MMSTIVSFAKSLKKLPSCRFETRVLSSVRPVDAACDADAAGAGGVRAPVLLSPAHEAPAALRIAAPVRPRFRSSSIHEAPLRFDAAALATCHVSSGRSQRAVGLAPASLVLPIPGKADADRARGSAFRMHQAVRP
jgi:hypothetical protein